MLVRVYTDDCNDLRQIKLKSLDVAGKRYQEYFDLVVSPDEYSSILSSGLRSEVVTEDIGLLKEEFLGQYHSYDEVTDILRDYVTFYPLICKLDSIGLSYEGRWVYALKISDQPEIEDSTEPGVLFDGLHHAREWATIETVLFYADTLLNGYGIDPIITDLIDNNEIWLIPIVNVDGYVYDYPGQNMWRKNREPYLGYIGTDPNRNYNGALNEDPHGDWCSVPSGSHITNYPGSNVFCGAYAGFADVIDAMMEFHKEHDINANITYHSYAEEIIWPWAYTDSMKTPDSIAYEQIAQAMASKIHRLGSGYYQATGSLYPNTGTTRTWVYGYHHYVKGTSCLSYTIEIGTSFYQPVGDLDFIAHENWKGALYLALRADSIREFLLPDVPSPALSLPDSLDEEDSLTVYWLPIFPDWTHPDRWQLDQLDNYSFFLDSIESGTVNWILTGFSQSSARAHSGNYSLYSDSTNNIANVAMTKYPYLVRAGDTLSFWCWYDLEDNYDITVVEVSQDLNEWIQLNERYSGYSGNWVKKEYSLTPWANKAIYIRFRTVTDDNTLEENFYVDDVYPVPVFETISMIDSSITGTTYTLTGLQQGEHYFRVRGHNDRGWGNYSNIKKTTIYESGITDERRTKDIFYASVTSNFREILISYIIPDNTKVNISLYDITGRKIKEFDHYETSGRHTLCIKDCKSGVYFIQVKTDVKDITRKVIIIK
ncbi:immune inhibitor A [candidate division WOR-3 bacterium]|nr:immune inhibitor A [candidate division WOR-3 bacterium]